MKNTDTLRHCKQSNQSGSFGELTPLSKTGAWDIGAIGFVKEQKQ